MSNPTFIEILQSLILHAKVITIHQSVVKSKMAFIIISSSESACDMQSWKKSVRSIVKLVWTI